MNVSIKRKEKGLTIHFKKKGDLDVPKELEKDTRIIKYHKKFKTWYGLCYNPESDEIKHIIDCSYPWMQSNQMDKLTEMNPVSLVLTDDH
ncbi:hypothetical protein [Rickettsiella massiliensis]|uniref:hypothetical protein n=1 Tax=Rickettsiella massiliensis TaxID=676517 RepID=UPI00029AED95|nr:hypothetical protein [Rickettsiella massiliensis]